MTSMKRSANSNPKKSLRGGPVSRSRSRRCIVLGDLTESLLQAYECVARRAYQKFLARGGEPGAELEDWLAAERELLSPITVDFQESEGFIHALAAAPCFSRARVDVSIEPHWLAILAERDANSSFGEEPRAASASDPAARKPAAVPPLQAFCIVQLPAIVVPKDSIAVLADGILGIRMPKAAKPANPAPAPSLNHHASR